MELSDLPAHVFVKNRLFASKLLYGDRCAILALADAGVALPLLAAAFHVNVSTVRYIVRVSSPHYKNVRKEYFELGPKAFYTKYVTDKHLIAVETAAGDPDLQLSQDALRKKRVEEGTGVAHKRNNKDEGHHTIKDSLGGVSTIEVRWYNTGEAPDYELPANNEEEVALNATAKRPEGWYILDNGKVYGTPADCATSTRALKAFLSAIMAEEVV